MREISKKFEETVTGTLAELATRYEGAPPKGEIVVLIGEATKEMHAAEADAALDDRLEAALKNHSIKDATALVAAELDLPKREVYARALTLAKKGA